LHICHLISSLEVGGAQKVLVGLAEEAAERGHRVSVICTLPGSAYGDRLAAAGVVVHDLSLLAKRTVPTRLAAGWLLRRRVLSALQRLRADVVHQHLLLPKLLLWRARPRGVGAIIQTQHDNSPWWGGRSPEDRLKTRVERDFARRTASFTVAISRSVARDARRVYDLPPERCPVIPNFVEGPASPLPERQPESPPTVLMLTRLSVRKKGIDLAIPIMERVRARLPEARMILVGEGADAAEVDRLIADARMEAAVERRGATDDVYSAYAEADVLLMPSRWEGFGLTAAEAALARVPVVASDVGGLSEVVVDGETGFTCPVGAVAAFADRVVELLCDPGLRERMGEAGRKRAMTVFSRKLVFERYEAIYREALERERALAGPAPRRRAAATRRASQP
jgi:glycosyltransferase involved in cell wall biosynthesis